jgi:hypothetical protein
MGSLLRGTTSASGQLLGSTASLLANINANGEFDAEELEALGIAGMGEKRFIAVDFDAEEQGSSSHQDSIVNDLTQRRYSGWMLQLLLQTKEV